MKEERPRQTAPAARQTDVAEALVEIVAPCGVHMSCRGIVHIIWIEGDLSSAVRFCWFGLQSFLIYWVGLWDIETFSLIGFIGTLYTKILERVPKANQV